MDVENLIGFPRPTYGEATWCRERYIERAAVVPGDLVVVACNHGAALQVGFAWRGTRLLLRSGQNGADTALLDVIANEKIPGRFASVVIASGDAGFADAAASLGRDGLDVTVVSNARALSRRLRLAAKRVVLFDAAPLPANPGLETLRAA